jgi:hypothetical protein
VGGGGGEVEPNKTILKLIKRKRKKPEIENKLKIYILKNKQ